MSHTLQVELDRGHADAWDKPYIVKVDGNILMTKQLNYRRFKIEKSASRAGEKHILELFNNELK